MSKDSEIYVRIWRGYSVFAATMFVIRSGHYLIGLADEPPRDETVSQRFTRRGESICEHAAKVTYLCLAFMSHFPDLFDLEDDSREHITADIWLVVMTALLHDNGELATGDIPDDGNAMHESKDLAEQQFFNNHVAPAFSWKDFIRIKQSYADFQNRSTHNGRILYCLDKIEAVLSLLTLERADAYGIYTAKPAPTAQDRHYALLTGTSCSTDGWAAHIKDLIRNFPVEITSHIFALLRVAVEDVRGEWFEWWDKI